MTQPISIADLKEFCGRKEKLRSVNKDTIAEILMKDNEAEPAGDNRGIKDMIKTLTSEVKELK